VDFRDLNRATPKDEFPMAIAETLINAAVGNKILNFLDGNAGYNQIFIAPKDIHKTAFRVPGVITFGLKNAGATYQRAMNYICHDLIGKLVEIYIDDVVVKSTLTRGALRGSTPCFGMNQEVRTQDAPEEVHILYIGWSISRFLGS
jgi:hypothetical protein